MRGKLAPCRLAAARFRERHHADAVVDRRPSGRGRGGCGRRCWTRPAAHGSPRCRRRPSRRWMRRSTAAERPSTAGRAPRPRIAPRCCCASRRTSRRRPTAYAALESRNTGKPLAAMRERRAAGHRGRVPLLRRRVPQPAGAGRGRIPARPHQHDPPRPGRRGRLDRAVELPADDGGLEDRAGDRRRQHPGAQALRADPAHAAEAGGGARRDAAGGRGQHRLRARRAGGQRDHQPRARAHGVAHRLGGDRAESPGRRGRQPQAHPPRARWQGAGHRLRRCRSRGGGRRRAHLRLLQRRPGLHRGLPPVCRQAHLRAPGRRSDERGAAASRSARSRRPASRWDR